LSDAALAVGRAQVGYPGGLAARFRWAGSGHAADVFSLSEAIGELTDYAHLAVDQPERACRAELRVEGPAGAWTARLAALVYDEPQGVLWDEHGLLMVKYGFLLYAFEARTGRLAWSHRCPTPTVGVFAAPGLGHVLLQTELETHALDADGGIIWRAAHNDVMTDAELLAGQLVLTSYNGTRLVLDARTGRSLA
jgi:hypothetical protein